jgi:hypothetical protein
LESGFQCYVEREEKRETASAKEPDQGVKEIEKDGTNGTLRVDISECWNPCPGSETDRAGGGYIRIASYILPRSHFLGLPTNVLYNPA